MYDSYGKVNFYTSSWAAGTNTLNAKFLYQGGSYDVNTGMYVFQHRNYSPTIMRWMQQDTMGYVDGAIDQNRVDTATGDSVDRYQYSYDRNGNVTSKLNRLNSDLDESYSYDDLDRLVDTAVNGTSRHSWDLDALGNMNSVTTGGPRRIAPATVRMS